MESFDNASLIPFIFFDSIAKAWYYLCNWCILGIQYLEDLV